MSRSFPCRRCGTAIAVPDAALTNPAATLGCPGCGMKYAKKRGAPAAATGVAPGPTAAGYTAPTGAAAPSASLISLGETRSESAHAAAHAAKPVFAAGDFVGNRYRIVRFVARGGMGEVYEAEDVELRGRIALKTIHPAAVAEGGAVERFKREIQL
ncbi:MAG: hypothetical protein NDJ75_05905, partial [Thermoanaerobaculia bacterium]|nr:hypothetical protein [Thermoanaerobaculia bacterium]